MPRRRKFLTVCNGGVVRSVTLAAMLKYWFDEDAVAASIDKNHGETMNMLAEWADVIVVVDAWMVEWFKENVPMRSEGKVKLVPIGVDRWGMSNHPELIEELMKHDLPAILGVRSSVWERRTHHRDKWVEHRRKLQEQGQHELGSLLP